MKVYFWYLLTNNTKDEIKHNINHNEYTLSTCTCQYSSCIVLAGFESILEKKVGWVRCKLDGSNWKWSAIAFLTFSFTFLNEKYG